MNHAAISRQIYKKPMPICSTIEDTIKRIEKRFQVKIEYNIVSDEKKKIQDELEDTVYVICIVFGIEREAFFSKSKNTHIVTARKIFYKICNEKSICSNYKLAKYIGQEYNMVGYALSSLQDLLDTNDTYATTMYNKVIEKLK